MTPSTTSSKLSARGGQALATGLVRVGPLSGLARLLRDLGCDPHPVFAAEGYDPGEFADFDRAIPYERASRLIARCTAATACEHLGLLLGERTVPSALGLVGYMLQTAPDVRTALDDLVSNLDLHDRGAVVTLSTTATTACFEYAIHATEVTAADQIYDLSTAVVCNIMRRLCGARWRPTAVHLSRREPSDPVPYTRFFRAPLHFDDDRSAVVFHSRWLEHRISRSDPILHDYLAEEASFLHAAQTTRTTGALRILLLGALQRGQVDAASLARQLGMHERTLNRRLREEGTSFRRELAAVRYELAKRLLAETAMSLERTAAALGYSDATGFIRAFKRWSGVPPATFRRNLNRAVAGSRPPARP